MKTYKGIILTILIILALGSHFLSLATYGAGYWFALSIIAGINLWFNWKYSAGEWPEMSFLKAYGISLAIAGCGIWIAAVCFSEQYGHPFPEMLVLMFERTPVVFIKPVILTPVSLLIWRWLFKEPRTARLAIAAAPADI